MEIKAAFFDMVNELLVFLESFFANHRLIFFIAIIILLSGLYYTIKTIIHAPHTIFYLIYGVIAGMAVIWLGTGPSGLNTIKGADDLVVGLTFGAVVGFLIGLAMASGEVGGTFRWSSIIAIPLGILSTCICIVFLGGAVMIFIVRK